MTDINVFPPSVTSAQGKYARIVVFSISSYTATLKSMKQTWTEALQNLSICMFHLKSNMWNCFHQ